MPPKAAAEKKPSTAGKAPAGKAPAEKKEAGKKTAAPTGEKKKRTKARKETYSSYIYKGLSTSIGCLRADRVSRIVLLCSRPMLRALHPILTFASQLRLSDQH
jgi:hypothetical protein